MSIGLRITVGAASLWADMITVLGTTGGLEFALVCGLSIVAIILLVSRDGGEPPTGAVPSQPLESWTARKE